MKNISENRETDPVNWIPEPPHTRIPLISICIPTFNRSDYLKFLLECINQEVGPDSSSLEVVVSDNNSNDDTYSVVREFQEGGLNLKYIRNYKNKGFDLNLRGCIAAAIGKYCWLMGDDDSLRKGAIQFMASHLSAQNPDVALANRFLCNSDLKVTGVSCITLEDDPTKLIDCNNRSEMINYFRKCGDTIGMFNFISTIVVKRSSWMRAPETPGMSRTMFPHIYKILDILRNQSGRILCIKEPLVYARANARLEGVHGGSEFKDWQLHFAGNIEVADHFFSDDSTAFHAFLSPLKRIIEANKSAYLALAEREGYTAEAFHTLVKLNIPK